MNLKEKLFNDATHHKIKNKIKSPHSISISDINKKSAKKKRISIYSRKNCLISLFFMIFKMRYRHEKNKKKELRERDPEAYDDYLFQALRFGDSTRCFSLCISYDILLLLLRASMCLDVVYLKYSAAEELTSFSSSSSISASISRLLLVFFK